MAEIDGMLSALSWPQRALKEGISGDEYQWFKPDGMNPHLYAAGNTFLDLVADPLNLIPVGLFAKAGRGLNNLRGGMIGAAPNYIKSFYGPTDAMTRPVERIAANAATRAGASMPQSQAVGGMAQWGTDAITEGTKNILSPSRRAAIREGINPGTQRWVREYVEAAGARNKEKAMANINYMEHIKQQAGNTAPMHPAVKELAHRSNLETYTPNQPGVVKGWIQKNSGTEATGEAVELADDVAQHVEDHVMRVWDGADTVVMKRARSGPGGNHYTDMYAGRNPMARPVASEVVKQMAKHGDDWAKHMPKEGKNWKLSKVNDDGSVWITSRGRNVGSAITEGGVNWLAKIDKDGTIMSVISDKHDFLEKVPGIGTVAEARLPNSLIAVTPPMFTNVKNMMKKQAKDLPAPTRAVKGVQRKPKPKEPSNLTLLEEFVSAKPSEQGVKAEQLRQAGMLTATLPLINNLENE